MELISRQSDIDAVDKYVAGFDAIDVNFLDGLKTAKQLIKELPPIQPEIIRCKDCKYARLTDDGSCKYCDIWFPDEAEYMDGDYYCASAERKSNG